MKWSIHDIRSVGLLAAVFLFVSCSKEDLVAPCEKEPDATELRSAGIPAMGAGTEHFEGAPTGAHGNLGGTDLPGDDGISDDGDDQPDNERSKKSERSRQ